MKKQKKKQKAKFLIICIILISLCISLILINKNKNLQKNKVADAQAIYTTQIGTNNTVVNFENVIAKTNSDVNKPELSAGMIPIIKVSENLWEIVSPDDVRWYNYTTGKFAYVMLSDRKNCI